jgi:outer membrane lipoprotein-sorting protein
MAWIHTYTRGTLVTRVSAVKCRRVYWSGPVILILVLILGLDNTATVARTGLNPESFAHVIEEMQQAYDQVDHYTATFLIQERVDRELRPTQKLELKFKKPLKIYLRWLKGKHEGRQALYPAGVDGNELWVRQPLLVGAITISLDPKSPRARKGSRHPITDVGIGKLLNFVTENASRGMQRGELTIEEHGQRSTFDRPAQRYLLHFPNDPTKGYYCMTALIDVDREYRLPIYAEIFDWQSQLIERYGYRDVHLNPGLREEDFHPNNPAYGF